MSTLRTLPEPVTDDAAEASRALRKRLGVPDDAARVLVFVESSHWDTNWLQTSDEYFKNRLDPIFAAVLDALERDPKRVYCIESVFFLKLYWERRPERRFALRRFLNNRQLRIMASSLTTPDTLLPHTEAIVRDFHLGQTWLRQHGFDDIHPKTATFPDNFGHSPHLPSLMRAVGVEQVAVTRIDGMYFVGSDWRMKSAFPLAGSTAELLEKEHKTLDFFWQDDSGSEILCHWNAFTYFHGDMLGHAGIIRWMGKLFGVRWRTCAHIARQINGYARQLAPLSRTPYLMCPIGMDFNDPIPDLRQLLDRYNDVHYAKTGTWAVLAGFDDYFTLVAGHREALPSVAIDPNPYWTGFYATRPTLKQRPARVVKSLLAAEKLAAFGPRDAEVESSLRDAWTHVALINHHDAITGTSPDRIFKDEQEPWMDRAEASLERATESLRGPHSSPPSAHRVHVAREGDALKVETPHLRMVFSEQRGGCLTSLVSHGAELLGGLGFDLVSHDDDGGLWRLGHEYVGGTFAARARASDGPATLEVAHDLDEDALTIVARSVLAGHEFTRTVTVRGDEPFVRLRVSGRAARRTTVTCRFETNHDTSKLSMNTLGGAIQRPAERLYSPTFWPVPSLATLHGDDLDLHASFEAPTAVAAREPADGHHAALEWIVARNAPKERAFRVLPVLAHPIGGTSDEAQSHTIAIYTTRAGVSPRVIHRRIERAWVGRSFRSLHEEADALVRCDDAGVNVVAVKRADAGPGTIVRLDASHAASAVVRLELPSPAVKAWLCDGRERNLRTLAVEGGRVVVPLDARIVTVRLLLRERSRA